VSGPAGAGVSGPAGAGVSGPVGRWDAVDTVVGLARTLRETGIAAAPSQVAATVAALDRLDPSDARQVYWAGRITLCVSRADLDRYDRAFGAYFGGWSALPNRAGTVPRPRRRLLVTAAPAGPDDASDTDDTGTSASAAASSLEVLRRQDITTLTPEQRRELHRLLAALSLVGEVRRSRRAGVSPNGRIDRHRTASSWLAAGGEPGRLAYERPIPKPRRIVLLVDVSGSMGLYADALLRFAHAVTRGSAAPVEAFCLGTRLTRVTGELSRPVPDDALRATWDALADAGGGTRLGVLVKELLDRWGQSRLARGAIVVIFSDGWECGDPRLLGDQMARLHRLAHRVVWSNPRKAAPGFAPIAGGMAAALPHVDDFVEGHSLGALEHLADVVLGRVSGERGSAGRGHGGRGHGERGSAGWGRGCPSRPDPHPL